MRRGGRRYNPGCGEQDDESRLRCRVREPVGARLSRIERAAAWAVCGALRRNLLAVRIAHANHAAPQLGLNRPVTRTGGGQTWTGRVV
jgi:hypothetical protein